MASLGHNELTLISNFHLMAIVLWKFMAYLEEICQTKYYLCSLRFMYSYISILISSCSNTYPLYFFCCIQWIYCLFLSCAFYVIIVYSGLNCLSKNNIKFITVAILSCVMILCKICWCCGNNIARASAAHDAVSKKSYQPFLGNMLLYCPKLCKIWVQFHR